MDTVMVLGILALVGLIVGWIGYSAYTDSIIRDQEREIARLKSELRRAKGEGIRPAKPDFGKW